VTPNLSAKLPRELVERVYPLLPLQAGMLYHELMSPGVSPYHRQVRFSLEGEVDPALCEAAWNALLARHPLLRSVFDYERTAQPVQVVLKAQSVEFHWEETATDSRIARWRVDDALRGFDLRRDRLLRVALFRRAPGQFEMVWSHPHILLDGWSGAVLAEEFAHLYAAGRSGLATELPPAPDPDAFMAARAARDGEAALRHWAALLDGYTELAAMPRLPRGDAPPRHSEQRCSIGVAETGALRALAASCGATLGVLLQALWGLVLGRWTGRQDVVFGIASSGRSVATPGIDRLVGMFVNTIPVRVRWSESERLADLLHRLQHQADAATDHDQAALAQVQAASALPNGVLDNILVLENYPAGTMDAATGFTVTHSVTDEGANYDFGVLVHAGDALGISLPHDAARFAPGQMARTLRHLQTLVAAVLTNPRRPLSELDCVPAQEQRVLAVFGRGLEAPWPEQATLAQLFQAQVARSPGAPALVAGGERLSFAVLDQAADGIAARLSRVGLAPGAVVGVMCGRDAGRIAALLGIMKTGATYLPLSRALPDARIGFMLDDSGCSLVLAGPDEAARLQALRPGVAMPLAGEPGRRREECPATARDIAYIIYTSGSTGQPKGVAVEHGGFVNMITDQIRGFGIGAEDRVLQFASCSFDASLSEIFMALLSGACLVMAPDGAIRDGAALLSLMSAEAVSVATLPPSYLRALDGADLGVLRVLITAGEPPDPADVCHNATQRLVFNAYGPTEASVCASWHRLVPGRAYAAGIPIGRPIANTSMTVRGPDGRPMPLGAAGEICLAGRGLARGYLGQPVLTARRFPVLNGQRIYRTGDSGLVQDDGEVLYLGRLDGQVKLNGHRIEPGEIEHRLRCHPQVAQAAAVVTANPPRLLAFVVPSRPVDPAALRRDLADAFPPWMVPAAVIAVASLPRNIAGKLDRQALAAAHGASEPRTASLDATEQRVAEAFAAVLGGGPYQRDSSFAGAGGDSLRAIRLLGRLRRSGMALELRDMLAADTVSGIARATAAPNPAGDDRAVTGRVPAAPAQRWFFALDPEGAARLNHTVLLRAGRPLDSTAVAEALDAVWRHHDALRLTFARGCDGWVGHCAAPGEPFSLRIVDLRAAADPWPLPEAHQPPPAGRPGPLFRAAHYRLRESDHLLLAAHHLLVDAVSWRIIVEDLASALVEAAEERRVQLPAKTTSYQEWASSLARAEGMAAAERERAYWEGVAPPGAPSQPYACHALRSVGAELGPVDPAIADRRHLARLLTRLGAALHRWDGRQAMHVTLTSHGRQTLTPGLDVSRTVGWFTADFPFLLDCRADAAAIEAALAAVPFGGVGWGVLRWLSARPPSLAEPELRVNFVGRVDFPPDTGLVLSDQLPGVFTQGLRRTRRIEVDAVIQEGRLTVTAQYDPEFHETEMVEALLRAPLVAETYARECP
jgi:amino acid adenylation domain-containing protein/non-ribosomal peptide synthase protein (TIGR01720 family)